MARKDWLTQYGEKHTEALGSDKRHWITTSSIPQEQSFWRNVPRPSQTRGQPTCLQTVSERTAYLISQWRKTDIRMKSKEQLQKQSTEAIYRSNLQPPVWHLSSPSIHEPNCAIRQQKQNKPTTTTTNKKALGKDGTSREMIHHLGSVDKQKLLDMYNQSWNTGTCPTSWKEAISIPILKKGKDRYSKTSYCSISLLSCLGKTMEHMVNRRLQRQLEMNRLLSRPPPPPPSLALGRTKAQRTKWHCLPRISRMASSRRWRHRLSLSTSPRLSTKYGRRVFSSSS